MSSAWSGFSEEDLRRMKGQSDTPAGRDTNRSRRHLQKDGRSVRRGGQTARPGGTRLGVEDRGPAPDPELAAAMLAPTQARPASTLHEAASNATPPVVETRPREKEVVTERLGEPSTKAQPRASVETTQCGGKQVEVKELDKDEVQRRELTRLEMMQQEQQHMEEENKRKRNMLASAIAESAKRTQAESARIASVRKELNELDGALSWDVALLRSKIEEACMAYHHARKRYERAEAEFVASKLELHRLDERRELLAEHLCVVIRQSEARKAERLETLMKALHLDSSAPPPALATEADTAKGVGGGAKGMAALAAESATGEGTVASDAELVTAKAEREAATTGEAVKAAVPTASAGDSSVDVAVVAVSSSLVEGARPRPEVTEVKQQIVNDNGASTAAV
ncbi:RAB6-interacting golgin [Petromyzon marinus]|uniref:RAB6-interacting golgin n=1 Tax=Petromyzon marinus TaxID=7757 RepID=UPI003F6F3DCC